jgi:predicted site-specific integrase-resolvase
LGFIFSTTYNFQKLIAKVDRKMTVYGYARVSTADEDYERQVDELRAAGATKLFTERKAVHDPTGCNWRR